MSEQRGAQTREPNRQREGRRGVFDGFEGYRSATDEDYRNVLTQGLVVPDTNVLLNLYRYNDQARSDLLAVLGRLGDRLWVPNQVLVEFWRNREAAVKDPEATADEALGALEAQRLSAVQGLRTWANRVALEPARLVELQETVDTAFGTVRDAIAGSIDHETIRQALDTNTDPVLGMLDATIAGRVGAPWTVEEHSVAIAEGLRRVDAGVPPGYKDASKSKASGDGAAGDYLVWAEVLSEAAKRKCDVLLVTGDVKEDWWRRDQGETRGPRIELVEELRSRAGVRLFMLRPESLLAHARRVLDVQIRDESLEDVGRVDRFAAERDSGGWTPSALRLLLDRLDTEAPVQAQVIRRAAQLGGFVGRDEVYEIGDYDESRTLRGFTRPANRIAQEFRENAIVPLTTVDVLEAVYDPAYSSVQAHGFRIPAQLAAMIQGEAEGS